MQTIKIPLESELAQAIVAATHLSIPGQIIVSVKTTDGTPCYRGLVHKWTSIDGGLNVELENWNEHWGELAAMKYHV